MKLRVSGTLLRFVDYEEEIDVEAVSVGAALDALVRRHPQLRAALYDARGNVRATHALFVNGERVSERGPATPLGPRDFLEVVTAIAGG